MQRRLLALALPLVLAFGAATAHAQAPDWKKIRIGVEGAYPPFSEVGPDGKLKGFDIDIAMALCAELKAECTLVQQEWDGMMPALGAAIGGDVGVTEVAAYVQSLSGIKADPALAEAGKTKYAGVCAACHGADGKGNPALGAPDLTNKIWVYGGSVAAIAETITQGRAGVMPAFKGILTDAEIHLASAYFYGLTWKIWTINN